MDHLSRHPLLRFPALVCSARSRNPTLPAAFATRSASAFAFASFSASLISRMIGSVLLARRCTQPSARSMRTPSHSSMRSPANAAFTFASAGVTAAAPPMAPSSSLRFTMA